MAVSGLISGSSDLNSLFHPENALNEALNEITLVINS